jgi:ADP-heptose:LPS heptosyltransferase
MPLNRSEIKKILIITLSNIGDVILTFPVIDILRQEFPQSFIKIVVGPKVYNLLKNNPQFQAVEIFDKHQKINKTIGWVKRLMSERYDLVVDLRHTAIPLFVFPKYRTSIFGTHNENLHMKDKHLSRLKTIYPFSRMASKQYSLYISPEDNAYIRSRLGDIINASDQYVVVAPGAANRDKRFSEEGFAVVCDEIAKKFKHKIVFVGDWEDKKITCRVLEMMSSPAINLCGETTLTQLAAVLRHSSLALVNDSAPMHMASYLNIPTVAIFGPSNPSLYGPWSDKHIVLHNNKTCQKCLNPASETLHKCMQAISTEEILRAVNNLMQMIVSK